MSPKHTNRFEDGKPAFRRIVHRQGRYIVRQIRHTAEANTKNPDGSTVIVIDTISFKVQWRSLWRDLWVLQCRKQGRPLDILSRTRGTFGYILVPDSLDFAGLGHFTQ
jgi:hypothetical protein